MSRSSDQAPRSPSQPEAAARPGHVWVDGVVKPALDVHVSAFDRGFQLGDGVFETLRSSGGRPIELQEHAARLRASAAGLDIPLPDELESWLAEAIATLLAAEGLDRPDAEGAIRVTVSRGVDMDRSAAPPADPRPTIVVQVWPAPPDDPVRLERGLHLITSAVRHDPESPLAALKLISRADHVYARLEARRMGADDAVFLTPDGYLAEATSANLFVVRGAELATPSLACGILAGTTRAWLLAWAGSVGLTPVEGLLTTRDVHEAAEVFVSSSVAGIVPVTRFDGRPVGDGRPGPWTGRAREARRAAP